MKKLGIFILVIVIFLIIIFAGIFVTVTRYSIKDCGFLCVSKSSVSSVCGLTINKVYGETGIFNPEIVIKYQGIDYETGSSSLPSGEPGNFGYTFGSGKIDTTLTPERVVINSIGDLNNRPPKGYSDIIFDATRLSNKDFETISDCIKSNKDSVQSILNQVPANWNQNIYIGWSAIGGYGTLRELIYTNRDPYPDPTKHLTP